MPLRSFRPPSRRLILIVAFAALAVVIPACAGAHEGALLVVARGTHPQATELVDLRSGQRVLLPLSPLAQRSRTIPNPDTWSANTLGGDLVRVDAEGRVDFFDRHTLQPTGGFSIARIPGTHRPEFVSDVKPSRDGRFVLAYWKPSNDDHDPRLAAFDRDGRVYPAPDLRYERFLQRGAFDWLPNHQYVFIANSGIVLSEPGRGVLGSAALPLPAGALARGELATSPDGNHLVVSAALRTGDKTSTLLFLGRVNGQQLHSLTVLSARAQSAALPLAHTSPHWSPSGQEIAFSISTKNGWSHVPTSACPPVLVVPVSAQAVPVTGLSNLDDPALALSAGDGQRLDACDSSLSWFAR
jgi:hypothetical protein